MGGTSCRCADAEQRQVPDSLFEMTYKLFHLIDTHHRGTYPDLQHCLSLRLATGCCQDTASATVASALLLCLLRQLLRGCKLAAAAVVETAVVVVAGELTIDEIVEWLHRHRRKITAHEVELIAKVSQH